VGDASNDHSEADVGSTYSMTGLQLSALDLSSVFSALAAGDFCGVLVDHNAIGTTVNYYGIRMRYSA